MAQQQKVFDLGVKSIGLYQEILGSIATTALAYRTSLETRIQTVQQYIEKASDRSVITAKGRIVNKFQGRKDKIGNTEIALVKQKMETAAAYFDGAFLTGFPIFAATAKKDYEDTAAMLNVLVEKDQDHFSWVTNLMQVHEDVLCSPICAVEVSWEQVLTTTVGSDIDPKGGQKIGVSKTVAYSGNQIKRIAPENLIIDTSVDPCEVHTKGTFAGYVERMPYVIFKQFYAQLNDLFTVKVNKAPIFQGASSPIRASCGPRNLYRKPIIHANRQDPQARDAGDTDWVSHFASWDGAPTERSNLVRGAFEVTRLYVRVALHDFGSAQLDRDEVHVVKLIYVNGWLAYVEPLINSHGMLPIVVGQLTPGDINTTCFSEYLLDLQDLSTAFVQNVLASMRRAVGDRALYDPRRINPEDMNSDNPVGKIPVNMNSFQQNFDAAYKQIPYTDNTSGNMLNMFQFVERLADSDTGLNQAQQGNFVRGNKTRAEFTEIMSNSQARIQRGAVYLDSHFYNGIKQIIRANYLLYAQSGEVQGRDAVVAVDASQLRQMAPEFKMSTGLMPTTKMASTEILLQAAQIISSNPMLNIEYDAGQMYMSSLKQMGLNDLPDYRRSPEEQQRMAQLMMGMPGGTTPAAPGGGAEE